MATRRPGDRKDIENEEDEIEESIEVAGVPLVVWAARLSLFLLIQGLIVLGSYAYYGFGPDPIHAAVNLVWWLAGSVIGLFMPRLSISFVLAFAVFFTLFAGFGTFTADHFDMRLDTSDNLSNWAMALAAWAIGIYALWQAGLHAEDNA